jgi:hypothetical protein
MAVRSITRYENSACPITVSDRKSQIPKTDVIEFNCKLFAYGLMEECAEIEVVFGRSKRNRRVEKPALSEIDSTQKFPVTLEVWLKHVVIRLARETFQQ